jgi:hypothetical protein
MDIFNDIERQLKLNEYTDFNQFSESVLALNKTNSLKATLELGLRATSIGQSFAAGYRCALQSLWPKLNSKEWAALCVSETQGNHPKKIITTVTEQGVLKGHKSFVSMAEQAEQLIIIAKSGETHDRPILKAVLVSQSQVGVEAKAMPNIGMLPDINHGSIELNNAEGIVLPGDGHADFSRRFRYLEDVHLLMAFVSLILSKSLRNNLDPEIVEKCLVLVTAIVNLDKQDSHWQHLHLSGLFREFEGLALNFEAAIEDVNGDFYQNWMRDKKIFSIASRARKERTKKAIVTLKRN